jgi:neopullulanase
MSTADAPDWVPDAIFYQVFPDRFARHSEATAPELNLEPWEAPPTIYGFKGGTLKGIEERLDYLEELGVNAIYLNPIFQSPANHRYHTHDYFEVDPILGEKKDFDSLLAASHGRGIRIILDGVFNHVGRGFYQFNHVLENGASSPYVDWFHLNPDHLENEAGVVAYPGREHREKLGSVGGTYDVLGYRAWADLPPLPKLNTDTGAVRELLLRVAEYWIKEGADGWRLDVPQEIDDPHFWREFRRRVRAHNPQAYLVGEIWTHAADWLRGDRFDGVMNYPFSRNLLGFLGGDSLDKSFTPGGFPLPQMNGGELAKDLESHLEGYRPETNTVQLNLLGSHDTPRLLTLLSGHRGRAALAMLFLFLLPGAPSIYYGDEVGMSGGEDPECRGGFPWNRDSWDRPLLESVRSAIALRKGHPALRRGEYTALLGQEDQIVIARWKDGDLVVGAFNRSDDEATVRLPNSTLKERLPTGPDAGDLRPELLLTGTGGTPALSGAPRPPRRREEGLTLHLPPLSGSVYTTADPGEVR